MKLFSDLLKQLNILALVANIRLDQIGWAKRSSLFAKNIRDTENIAFSFVTKMLKNLNRSVKY